MPRTLSRAELTATLAARQLLIERAALDPVRAIRRLTPLQAQEPRAPYIALAARLEGFTRQRLERALATRSVVKTTLMRATLHLVAADEYPAFAQLARAARLRTWRKKYAHLDEERVVHELRSFFAGGPRSNNEIRDHVLRHPGVPDQPYHPIIFARTLLPLVQVPPAGFWSERRQPRFVIDARPLPDLDHAAELLLRRYLVAFGPASRRDIAAWAGVTQRDFAPALERVRTVSYRDEQGVELLDLPRQRIAPADLELPVRFLSRWDQVLLAHDDRARILSPEIRALNLTLSGDQTVTVDGLVVASWLWRQTARRSQVGITLHAELSRAQRSAVREEARATARWLGSDAERVEILGV